MALVSDSMSQVAGATQDVSATILEMKASVEEIAGTAEVLGGSVETSVTSTNELATVAEHVRGATGQLKQSGEEAVSFLSELGTSLGETQGNSETLSRLAHRVTTLAEGGSGNVSAVEQEVRKSLKGFEESHRALAELRAAMDSIGRILDVIQDITEQTNLLSLNASIIAAGAGEHGKAFGVVATQIRELSAKTKLRAAEIRDVVRSIQRGGEQISGAMEHVYRTVSRSSELSRDADNSLRAILEAASEQEDMTQRIAAASEELAHGGISASRTMQQIFSMIEGIGRSVQEQASSTRLLTVEAEKVRDGVLHLRRATEEQARGAQVISEATASITRDSQDTSGTVQIQAERSRATVKGMQDLTDRAVAIQHAFESLAEAAVRLERSATALDLEVRKFKLPEA
jgi:methyl-accepting chemotaxis protein